MGEAAGNREEDGAEDPQTVTGVVKTATCWVTKTGLLVINGRQFETVFFIGKASRECTTCFRTKPWGMFYKNSKGTRNRSQRCRKCSKELAQVIRHEYQPVDYDPFETFQQDEYDQYMVERAQYAREALRELTE